jgi:membrane-bound metal-dependent hydrolase YbcI (DUF457 family)
MPYAFGHLVGAWIVMKGYEFLSKKKMNRTFWGVFMLGAILPDIDFIVEWILNIPFHRFLTHSITFTLFAGLITFLFFKYYKKETKNNANTLAIAMIIGCLIHLALDMFYHPGILLLWPIEGWFSWYGYIPGSFSTFFSERVDQAIFAKNMLHDMVLGTLWIIWLYWRKNITF